MEYSRRVQDYLAILRRHAGAGLAVFVAVTVLVSVVGLVRYNSGPAYEASALLVINKSASQLNFDPRFQDGTSVLPFKAYGTLIQNADLERSVISALGPVLDSHERNPGALDAMLRLSLKEDSSMIQLNILASDGDKAMKIANTWADLFEQQAAKLQGTSGQNPEFIAQQLTLAEQALQQADDNLTKFYQTSPLTELQARLTTAQRLVADYGSAQSNIDLLTADAVRLQGQLRSSGGSAEPAGISDVTSVYMLELRAADTRGVSDIQGQTQGNTPGQSYQLQIPLDSLGRQNMSVGQAADRVDRLIAGLSDEKTNVAEALRQEMPELSKITEQTNTEKNKLDHLTLTRDSAKQTYTTLRNKADEARIATDAGSKQVRVASYAQVASFRELSKTRVIGLAAVVGILAGIAGAFAVEYLGQVRRNVARPTVAKPAD